MALPVKKIDEKFSYADYYNWPDDERWELIDGRAYSMSPAPTSSHQLILGELYLIIANHLKGKKCTPFLAPFDVRLPDESEADEEIFTVVQPDLSVICDRSKIDERGCLGAPTLLIEILSPSSVKRDRELKLELYERHGVKEYWIVHPHEKSIDVYKLDEEGGYGRPELYESKDTIEVPLLGDLKVELEKLFSDLPHS